MPLLPESFEITQLAGNLSAIPVVGDVHEVTAARAAGPYGVRFECRAAVGRYAFLQGDVLKLRGGTFGLEHGISFGNGRRANCGDAV